MNRNLLIRLLTAVIAVAGLAGSLSTASAYDFFDHNCASGGCQSCGGQSCGGQAGGTNLAHFCGGCTGRCCDCGYMLPIRRAQWYNWNRNYAYTDYGQPTALVVPPTANLQTNWGWGVASSRISRIDHQFQRNYPGYGPFGGPPRSTPVWPSDTTQFGVFPVRGPW
jgi:hypothetical protein